jgi:hypothetical protein
MRPWVWQNGAWRPIGAQGILDEAESWSEREDRGRVVAVKVAYNAGRGWMQRILTIRPPTAAAIEAARFEYSSAGWIIPVFDPGMGEMEPGGGPPAK